MQQETEKYMKRMVERLEVIHHSSTPWNVREQLEQFIKELKAILGLPEIVEAPEEHSSKAEIVRKLRGIREEQTTV